MLLRCFWLVTTRSPRVDRSDDWSNRNLSNCGIGTSSTLNYRMARDPSIYKGHSCQYMETEEPAELAVMYAGLQIAVELNAGG